MRNQKTIRYYCDELRDDFAGTRIETKKLPDNYKYIRKCPVYRFNTFIVYRLLVTPAVTLYVKVRFHQHFRNKKVLRKSRRSGYFLFGNHTNGDLDAFVPTMIAFPKKPYIIVNPDATSIKGIRTLVGMLGALPLPNGASQYRKFLDAVSTRVGERDVVTVYPEAHIWPYYTDIRDFDPTSLTYACLTGKPVYSFTNIYKKRLLRKRPRVVTYIDGPFYPDPALGKKENVAKLKEEVYGAMKRRVSENPKYEYKYSYVKADSAPPPDTAV